MINFQKPAMGENTPYAGTFRQKAPKFSKFGFFATIFLDQDLIG